jgi:hypothetical protein
VPQVSIKIAVEDREETLSEYLCDWPDCPHIAVEVVGFVRELGLATVVCPDHAAMIANRANDDPARR